LSSRDRRPLTREELKLRDETEIARLGTGTAIADAGHRIVNEKSIEAFQDELERFWKRAIGSPIK